MNVEHIRYFIPRKFSKIRLMYQVRPVQYLASRLLFGLCITWIGCQTNIHDEQTNSRVTPRCQLCPSIQVGQDTLDYINDVRRFVARTADFGNLENELCENAQEKLETFGVDTFLRLFEADAGKSTCSLNAKIMVQILLEHGIDAYTYNFGFEGTRLTHVVVLVKHHRQLLIFDPYLNYALLNSDGTNMDIISLIEMVGSGNLVFRTTKDTVEADLLIDEEALNRTPELRDSILDIPGCADLVSGGTEINTHIKKVGFQRCYDCELNRTCFNLIAQFESMLNQETGLHSYHESMVLKIANVWGAHDSQEIDELIESAIYTQPDMGDRVKGNINYQ